MELWSVHVTGADFYWLATVLDSLICVRVGKKQDGMIFSDLKPGIFKKGILW